MRVALLLLVAAAAACTKQTPAPKHEPALERIELVTGTAEPKGPLPVIVALHGLDGRPENFARIFDGPTLDAPARVIVPRAPHANGHGGYYWFPIRTREGKTKTMARDLAEAADLVDRLLVELSARDDVRGKPIITGFSQGGMLSFAVAARHPDHIRTAIPISGWLPEPLLPETAPDEAPPIRALHGEDDPVIPIELSRRSCAKLEALGYDVKLLPYEGVGHRISPAMHDQWAKLIAGILPPE